MDLVAEYARVYGGPPRPSQPWHEFVALVDRVPRCDARETLMLAQGSSLGRPVPEDQVPFRHMQLSQLERRALPPSGESRGV